VLKRNIFHYNLRTQPESGAEIRVLISDDVNDYHVIVSEWLTDLQERERERGGNGEEKKGEGRGRWKRRGRRERGKDFRIG